MFPRSTLRILVAALLFSATSVHAELPIYEKVLNVQCSDEELASRLGPENDPGLVPISVLERHLPATSGGGVADDIPAWVVEDFVDRINMRRAGARGRCVIHAHDGRLECDQPIHRSIDALATRDAVVLGTIEHLTDAWDTSSRTVVTLVHVRIDEILKDTSGRLAPGHLVTYTQPWGSTEVAGATLCTTPPHGLPDVYTPAGSRVVVAGSFDLRNEDHLVTPTARIFRVSDDLIIPHPVEFDSCHTREALSLDSLREVISQ